MAKLIHCLCLAICIHAVLISAGPIQKNLASPQLNAGVYDELRVLRDPEPLMHKVFTFENYFRVAMYAIGHVSSVVFSHDYLSQFEPSQLWSRLWIPEETNMDFVELCNHNGFDAESHTVVTKDGYINTLHRVRARQGYDSPQRKQVVLMNHGLEDSSDSWVLNGPEKSPAFAAATNGYDVWVSNTRGNFYSRDHVSLDPD